MRLITLLNIHTKAKALSNEDLALCLLEIMQQSHKSHSPETAILSEAIRRLRASPTSNNSNIETTLADGKASEKGD